MTGLWVPVTGLSDRALGASGRTLGLSITHYSFSYGNSLMMAELARREGGGRRAAGGRAYLLNGVAVQADDAEVLLISRAATPCLRRYYAAAAAAESEWRGPQERTDSRGLRHWLPSPACLPLRSTLRILIQSSVNRTANCLLFCVLQIKSLRCGNLRCRSRTVYCRSV